MRLLLDEMFPPAVAEQLRVRGHDVVAVAEVAGLAGCADREVFEHAQAEGRAVATENVPDFVRLDREWRQAERDHHGLVLALKQGSTGDRIVGRLTRDLHRLLDNHRGGAPTSLVTWL